ncbi:hypothetical protein H257_16991 [Aphanomyces astaci]|uniref:Uncharacterized protein n=1 Tax=Aphanomyces astaci TaxID=112090 RepID=W4FIA3_APHAT|nr:hypothetical protein H257_16991 [Aphanomyces astaci]ETV66554.1 hypothetical protein H257_16991 [Aphanomyces astaci]|eukprot:XP_009843925.1 hypothetical protein H257_16991 [Aphanomyces astaci]
MVAGLLALVVDGVDVSVVGLPGVFAAPNGRTCGGSDASRLGVCPGPQLRLVFGSCCEVVPSRLPVIVLGCVPRRSATPLCEKKNPQITTASTMPSSATPKTTTPMPIAPRTISPTLQVLTTELPPPSRSATFRPPRTSALVRTGVVPSTAVPPSATSKQFSPWVVVVGCVLAVLVVVLCSLGMQSCCRSRRQGKGRFSTNSRFLSTRTPTNEVPWVDVPDLRSSDTSNTSSIAMMPPPTPPDGAPRMWDKLPSCSVCGIEESTFVMLYRGGGGGTDLNCFQCSKQWL